VAWPAIAVALAGSNTVTMAAAITNTVTASITITVAPTVAATGSSTAAPSSASTAPSAHPGSASAVTPTSVLAGGIRFEKKGARAWPIIASVLRLVPDDIGGDLDDVGVGRAGRAEGPADVAHDLGCLRGEVAGTNQLTAFVDGYLARRVDRAPPGRRHHL
jgi:hypothetical protein